ncbi:hypothetical protein AB0910_23110 [Streptomyces sp. NPDC047002]|uniref:hypothetical protein n=1 Tax=Streptomyces sp. NPDC047002 TaxID=3155475 RepID=UPI003452551D
MSNGPENKPTPTPGPPAEAEAARGAGSAQGDEGVADEAAHGGCRGDRAARGEGAAHGAGAEPAGPADPGGATASAGPRAEATGQVDTDVAGESGGFGGGEVELRVMLHSAVSGIRPADGALEHLRAAVPARRARKRQALVGAAAAALLIGTAVPAFLHVADASDGAGSHFVSAGRGESTAAGTRPDGGRSGAADSPDDHGHGAHSPSGATAGDPPLPHGAGHAKGGRGADGSGAGPATPPGTAFAMTLPLCSADQLGVTASKSAPTSNGTVYGSFHVLNVSATECTVTGGDSLGFQASGAADPARISVVQHTAGDPAARLADAPQDSAPLALAPDAAYEVQFAFVPSSTCPTKGEGGSPDPTSSEDAPSSGESPGTDSGPGSDGGSDGSGNSADKGSSSGLTTQLVQDGGGTADGSVSVSHTPEAGVPRAETTIRNACAGTIYKTGPVGVPAA